MARIRSVKPELFLSEQVGGVSMAARMFFVGLFTQADKAGRVEWAPKRLKVQLFPYDEGLSVEGLAAELVEAGLARVYEVAGVWFLDIPGFAKHQRPHPKEPVSTAPECPNDWRAHGAPWKETASREKPGDIPSSPVGREGKEILDQEGKGATGAHDLPSRKRFGDPHGMRLDPNAAAHIFGAGVVVSVPPGWASKVCREYGLAGDDVHAFAAWASTIVKRDGFEDGGKRLAWLDGMLARWRAEKSRPNDGLRPVQEFIDENRRASEGACTAEEARAILGASKRFGGLVKHG